ncbi:MAG: hypothetical protein ABI763_08655 [Bacteroidota bacterium]
MQLLIIILMKMGFYYSPGQVSAPDVLQAEKVAHAQSIIDRRQYHFEADGGVVIEDDVDPVH